MSDNHKCTYIVLGVIAVIIVIWLVTKKTKPVHLKVTSRGSQGQGIFSNIEGWVPSPGGPKLKPVEPSATLVAQWNSPTSNPWLGGFAGEATGGPSNIVSLTAPNPQAMLQADRSTMATVI
jgi:hypothetical protein